MNNHPMTTTPKRLRRQLHQSPHTPWRALADIENEMEGWFGRSNLAEDYEGADFTPSCDFKDKKDEYIVKLDIPGVKKEDVKIEVEDNRLTIQGERREEKEEQDAKYYLSESYQGSFMRSFTLPSKVDENKVDARYQDGVLTIKIPKIESSKAKKIDIN